jgi:predicted transcriptional regulator
MAENDQNTITRVRKILENWITDTTTADNVAKEIVSAAHRHTYREIMDFVRYMQIKGYSKLPIFNICLIN